MLDAQRKYSLDAHVVKAADLIDGCCEALHEVFAGNPQFICPARTYLFSETDIPALERKFPDLSPILEPRHIFLRYPDSFDFEEVARAGKPHTPESILRSTDIPIYDTWRELTVRHFGIMPLIEQKEFFPAEENKTNP